MFIKLKSLCNKNVQSQLTDCPTAMNYGSVGSLGSYKRCHHAIR